MWFLTNKIFVYVMNYVMILYRNQGRADLIETIITNILLVNQYIFPSGYMLAAMFTIYTYIRLFSCFIYSYVHNNNAIFILRNLFRIGSVGGTIVQKTYCSLFEYWDHYYASDKLNVYCISVTPLICILLYHVTGKLL